MANICEAGSQTQGKKKLDFHNTQAAARKDVEIAFGISQGQFTISSGAARFWDQYILWYIMDVCVIMHNMIIENERGQDLNYSNYELMGCLVHAKERREGGLLYSSYHSIRQAAENDEIQKDLIEK